jgi:hypothetical protein
MSFATVFGSRRAKKAGIIACMRARFDADGWSRTVVAREDVTELHDSTVQHLAAASLNLMALQRARPKADGLDAVINTIEHSIAEAQREIRSVSYLLYPRDLDRDGLVSTLQRFVAGYSERTRIASRVFIDDQIDFLSVAMQRCVLRIVQKAVHRHSSAPEGVMRASIRRESLLLSVEHNGRGFKIGGTQKAGADAGVGIPGHEGESGPFRRDGFGTAPGSVARSVRSSPSAAPGAKSPGVSVVGLVLTRYAASMSRTIGTTLLP